MKKLLSFWDFWGDGGRDCRLEGGGQAQTLSYIENAFLLGNSEEHIFLLGFWGDGGRDCRLKGGGQAQTLSYIENAFLLGNSEENAFLLGWLGQACGEGVFADLRGLARRKP